MKTVYLFLLSFLATGLFFAAAVMKQGGAGLDAYLGSVWVLILSLIVAFSLAHAFVKSEDKSKDNAPQCH